jgi:hypothetical protein
MKHLLALKDMIDGSCELMSQDGQGLGGTMFPGQFIPAGYCLRISAEEKDCGFGEGPFQMGIADLLSGGAHDLSCRFLRALYESAVGGKVLYPGKTVDIMDLIEDDQAQDSSNPWNGSDAEIGIGIIDLGDKGYLMFDAMKQFIVVIYETQVELDAFLYAYIRKPTRHALAVAFLPEMAVASDSRGSSPEKHLNAEVSIEA